MHRETGLLDAQMLCWSHAFELACNQSERAMIITMISMRMMELSLIEIIDVIAMWNGLMSTFVMSTYTMSWGTSIRILAAYSDDMFIIVPRVG